MDLNELFKLISEYIDEDLDRRACSDIEESLRMDCDCRTFFNTFQKTVAMCRMIEKRKVPKKVHYILYRRLHIRIRREED